MNFLKVAGKDVSVILKNRFIRVSVVAIIIVPLLYSLLYLYAFWNPYEKLCDMPVAVVSMDKGGTKDGKGVNYGKEVVDKLKGNNSIGWRFVDYDDAKSGVEGKKYYGMFIIPEDFTQNVLTANKKELIQPKIEFISNDKRNFLAAQINGKVVVELKAEITKSITKEVDKVLFDNLNEIKDKMQLASDGSKKLSDGNSELADKVPEMKTGVGKLADGSNQLKAGLTAAQGGVARVYGSVSQINGGLGIMYSKMPELEEGANSLVSGAEKLSNGVNTKAVDKNGKPLGLKVGAEALYSGVNQLDKSINSQVGLKVGMNGIYGALTKVDADPTKNGIGASLKTVQALLQAGNIEGAKAIINGLVQQTTTNSPDTTKPTFLDAVTMVNSGVNQLSTSINTQLVPGAKGLVDGTAYLGGKLIEYNSGVKKLGDNLPALTEGISQLYGGSSKLLSGIAKPEEVKVVILPEGNSDKTLMNGVTQLCNGSLQLNDGLSTLSSKIPELQDGTIKLKDGSKELSDKLTEGSNKLNNNLLNDSKTMSEFLSKPVEIHEKSINSVKTYGEGFAPYFISLSLWVGGMLMFFVIPVDIDKKLKARSSSIVLGKFLSYGIIGIVQALLASAIVLTLGLQPNNILMYFAFNVLMSFTFIAIMQCLVFLMGDAGRLASIVLLILQLTACAGTFPLEVVPTFFKVLNPFMPFTYTVEALREIISGVDYSIVAKDAGILTAIMTASLVTSLLLKGHADKIQKAIKVKKEAAAYQM